jgi:hypothetical protein
MPNSWCKDKLSSPFPNDQTRSKEAEFALSQPSQTIEEQSLYSTIHQGEGGAGISSQNSALHAGLRRLIGCALITDLAEIAIWKKETSDR